MAEIETYERNALELAHQLGWELEVEDFRRLPSAPWAALVRWGGEVAEQIVPLQRVQAAWADLRAKGISPEEAILRVRVWMIQHNPQEGS